MLDICVFSQVMKPDFFVCRATSKTFKIFCLYSQGRLTFMENPIIRIAAKFQYKIPSLRPLAAMDTMLNNKNGSDEKCSWWVFFFYLKLLKDFYLVFGIYYKTHSIREISIGEGKYQKNKKNKKKKTI